MTFKYAWDSSGSAPLEIGWKHRWSAVTIRVNGQVVATLKGIGALKPGFEYTLPDLSVLHIKFSDFRGLKVWRNDVLLAPSPEGRLRTARGLLAILAVANFGLAVWAFVSPEGRMDATVVNAGAGGIFLAAALLIKHRPSTAVLVGLVLILVDIGLSIAALSELGIENFVVQEPALAVVSLLKPGMAALLATTLQGLRALRKLPPAPAAVAV